MTASPNKRSAEGPFRSGPVLVATDGEDQTYASLIAGRHLADRFHEPLEVVTVLEPLPIYTGPVAEGALPMAMETERRVIREENVGRHMETFGFRPDEWTLHVRYGSIARSIAATARDRTASVIVLAACPHRRLWRTVAGERAVHVLRAADCPVLSVAPTSKGTVRSAVVGVDFSATSVRAAQAALQLIEPGGTLAVLHVYSSVDPGDVAVMTDAFDRVHAVLDPLTPPGVTVDVHVAPGNVVSRILECASEIGADLIAVGTHGPTVIERLFVGSTATGVLHAATCSVLACPPLPSADDAELRRQLWGSVATPDRADWGALLDGVTKRNAGRKATIEVDDPVFGAQVQAVGLEFLGASYDRHDGRVDLMFVDGMHRTHHLTRTIAGADDLALCADAVGRDRALEVTLGRTATIVLFTTE